MRKLLFIVSVYVLLLCANPVSVCSESVGVPVSRETVQSMLQSSLEHGFSAQKDIQLLLGNAILNGYDHVKVIDNKDAGNIVIEVAIDGLASALYALQKDGSEESLNQLMQARDIILLHYQAVLNLTDMVGRDDIRVMFKVLDDELLRSGGYEMHIIAVSKSSDGSISILANIEEWRNQ
jgi:hypothetical protein